MEIENFNLFYKNGKPLIKVEHIKLSSIIMSAVFMVGSLIAGIIAFNIS